MKKRDRAPSPANRYCGVLKYACKIQGKSYQTQNAHIFFLFLVSCICSQKTKNTRNVYSREFKITMPWAKFHLKWVFRRIPQCWHKVDIHSPTKWPPTVFPCFWFLNIQLIPNGSTLPPPSHPTPPFFLSQWRYFVLRLDLTFFQESMFIYELRIKAKLSLLIVQTIRLCPKTTLSVQQEMQQTKSCWSMQILPQKAKTTQSLWGHLHKQKFPGWVRGCVFTLGCPGDGREQRSEAGLSVAHSSSYVSCCLENRALLWPYSRQITHLEWGWQTSDSSLVQTADANAPAHSQKEQSPSMGPVLMAQTTAG